MERDLLGMLDGLWEIFVGLMYYATAGTTIAALLSGLRNAHYARWYDSDVQPLMDEDERMRELSELTRARFRDQVIQRAQRIVIQRAPGGERVLSFFL
jgi:hypothetical protein